MDAAAEAALGVVESLSGRRWTWRGVDAAVATAIAQRLTIPSLLGQCLAARAQDVDTAPGFLEPTLRAFLPDPSTLADMDTAAERLARAVLDGETVGVFGDYDVDGACSGALMTIVLRALGCSVIPYVPDRIAEGYGPNAPALRALVDQGARLVVCVDCGTAAAEALAAIHNRADVIVLDHHKSEGPPPPVLATVNPNRGDCGSGLGMLCATAIAFLALVALLRTLRRGGFFAERAAPDLLECLDLVALATVCDVMPLSGLNRALVAQGLRVMERRARLGIAALLDVAAVRGAVSTTTLGFALGPRINAAGRIGECGLGLRLLTETDPDAALEIARKLDVVNRQRQEVEASMLTQALDAAERQLADGHPTVLIAGAGWHPGVVGIVAGRIKEKFNRPACVAGIAEGMARGSGRSVAGLDLGAAVIAARQNGLLVTGGGHAMAAGFGLPAAGIEAFHAFLDDRLAAAAALPRAALLELDAAVEVAGCTVALAGQLGRLAPFGLGNAEPMLMVPRARVVRADRIGRDGTASRAIVEGEGGAGRLKVLLFRAGDGPLAAALLARDAVPLHLVGHLRAEEWNGTVSANLLLRDAAVVR